LKKFAFVSEAAEREYRDLPATLQDEFGRDLRLIQFDCAPQSVIKHLSETVGSGVIELVINGRQAFRCVYVAKYADMVVVLHTFVKTTNGVDRKAMSVAKNRLAQLQLQLRKLGIHC
jgi:phage-related protein